MTVPEAGGFASAPEELLVGADSGGSAYLVVELSADGERAVAQAVEDYLRACAEQATVLEPDCPFESFGGFGVDATYRDVRWTIEEAPEVQVASFDGELEVYAFGGTARVTAVEDVPASPFGPATSEPFEDETLISVEGTATIAADGTATFEPTG